MIPQNSKRSTEQREHTEMIKQLCFGAECKIGKNIQHFSCQVSLGICKCQILPSLLR